VNVVGSGVSVAQRVMDFGEAGHILVSGAIAEVFDQLAEWRDCLWDLGTHEVKHSRMTNLQPSVDVQFY
jgi:class 3 adenylate cyclase